MRGRGCGWEISSAQAIKGDVWVPLSAAVAAGVGRRRSRAGKRDAVGLGDCSGRMAERQDTARGGSIRSKGDGGVFYPDRQMGN